MHILEKEKRFFAKTFAKETGSKDKSKGSNKGKGSSSKPVCLCVLCSWRAYSFMILQGILGLCLDADPAAEATPPSKSCPIQ